MQLYSDSLIILLYRDRHINLYGDRQMNLYACICPPYNCIMHWPAGIKEHIKKA